MNVLFVSGIAPIVTDLPAATALYGRDLGVPLGGPPEYPSTDDLEGVRHFGVWTLAGAAEACFGATEWPAEHPVPQASIEFDVDDVDAAAAELVAAGNVLLVEPKTEPWGQRVARLQSPDGLLIGVTFTPWMREPAAE